MATGLSPMTTSVSIHAPVKDATSMVHKVIPVRYGFNPRTRKGCDYMADVAKLLKGGFNPRTRKGCDLPIDL